jgi:hypothetical protein
VKEENFTPRRVESNFESFSLHFAGTVQFSNPCRRFFYGAINLFYTESHHFDFKAARSCKKLKICEEKLF